MFQKVRIYIWKKVVYFELRKLCGYPLWISFPELCTTPVLRQSLCLLRVPRDKQASTLFFVKLTCVLSRSVAPKVSRPASRVQAAWCSRCAACGIFGDLEFHGASKVSFQDYEVPCWQVQDFTGDWGLGRIFQWRSVY